MNEEQQKEIIRKIKKCLDKIRPYLVHDGGDVEFVSLSDGIVHVRMVGACEGCMSQSTTLEDGIEAMLLEEVPGVIGVENDGDVHE